MKILIIILSICTLLVTEIFSQRLRPFQIIGFTGLTPDWKVAVKDTVLSENTNISFIDEYNSITIENYIPPIVTHSGNIFQAILISGGLGLGGSLIECRNEQSGELIWQKRYGIYGDDFQTVIRIMRIDSSGRLVVMGQKRREKIGTTMNDDVYNKMLVFEDVLNVDNGELIETTSCGYHEDKIYETRFNPYGGVGLSTFYSEGSNYRYYEFKGANNKIFLNSVILNKCGEPVSEFSSIEIHDIVDNNNILKIGEDTILVLTKKYLSVDSTFAFKLNYYTKNLILLDSFLTKSFVNYPVAQEITGLSKDRKKIMIKWLRHDNEDNFPPKPESVGVFNLDGTSSKVIHLQKSLFSNFVAIDWERNDSLITIIQGEFIQKSETSFENFLVITEFYKMFENRKVINKFRVVDSLHLGIPIALSSIDHDKFLITFGQAEFYVKPSGRPASDPYASAIVNMLVDKDKFTKPVSSEDVVVEDEFAPIVFPNPGSDALHISWHQSFFGHIQIVDMTGKIVHREKVKNVDRQNLDTFTWPSGMYVIQIFDDTRQVVYKYKWVKN